MMTLEEARARVELIRAIAGDDERAHSEEDKLRADVLRAIMFGCEQPAMLAKVALETGDIEFARWCA